MSKLAVVTFTRGDESRWFGPMRASVQESLPQDSEHHIIQCGSHAELEIGRWKTLELAEYVCFVDDDDRVINDSLRQCLTALEDRPDVAVAFTNERYIDGEGVTLENPHGPDRHPTYKHAYESAQTIHHLVMMRTSQVVREAERLSHVLGIGSEWLMKASTALRGGAIHVPIEGYEWRKHAEQYSATDAWRTSYNDKIAKMRVYLAAQAREHGPIPRLPLPT